MHLRWENAIKSAHHVQKCVTRCSIQPLHKNKMKSLKPRSNFGAKSANDDGLAQLLRPSLFCHQARELEQLTGTCTSTGTMSLEGAVRSVGLEVALRQADSVHQLSRRSTSDPDATKVAKMRLAFSNHPTWVKTPNPKVTKEKYKGEEVYRVGFLHQANKGTKNKPFKHSKRHASLQLAEASMCEVRFAKESKSAKTAILKVLSGEAEIEALPKKTPLSKGRDGRVGVKVRSGTDPLPASLFRHGRPRRPIANTQERKSKW